MITFVLFLLVIFLLVRSPTLLMTIENGFVSNYKVSEIREFKKFIYKEKFLYFIWLFLYVYMTLKTTMNYGGSVNLFWFEFEHIFYRVVFTVLVILLWLFHMVVVYVFLFQNENLFFGKKTLTVEKINYFLERKNNVEDFFEIEYKIEDFLLCANKKIFKELEEFVKDSSKEWAFKKYGWMNDFSELTIVDAAKLFLKIKKDELIKEEKEYKEKRKRIFWKFEIKE